MTVNGAAGVAAAELGCGGRSGDTAMVPQPRLTPLWALKVVYCLGTGSGACLWKYMTVFYHHIGLTNSQIGIIQMLSPTINFCSQIGWAAICDWLKSYKEVLVVSNALGVATICCCLLPFVEHHFAVLCCVVLGSSAFMASRGSVNDSMTLQVVQDYKDARALAEQRGEVGRFRDLPTYGEQRLWGAAGWGFGSLFGGLLMDTFGIPFMFASFGTLLSITVVVIATKFPPRQASRANRGSQGPNARSFLSFEVLWFFANLLVYGMCMSLVETFLFVFLTTDFEGTTSLLLGSTVFVMCAFEVPVFLRIDKAFSRVSLTRMLTFCHYVFALRCVLYSILPRAHPVVVLLVEPLHGITFALMWSCSVEYGKRLAPEGSKAKMQALVNGLYYQLAIGCGSLFWGPLTEKPPKGSGFGFTTCYLAAAAVMVAWSWAWNLGWLLRRARLPDVPLLSAPSAGGDE